MYAAEAYFLRAEGALNGWDMGGTAEELYNMGIETSMKQWGITDQSAINAYRENNSVPKSLTDFLNSPAMTWIFPLNFQLTLKNNVSRY